MCLAIPSKIVEIEDGMATIDVDGVQRSASLMLLEQTLRQALQFGFAEDEIERAKKEIIAGLESRVVTESSQKSVELRITILTGKTIYI